MRHGVLSTYSSGKCRCDACRAAGAAYNRTWRQRNRGRVPPDVPHGRDSTYRAYACRCQPCKDAHAAYQRQWRKEVGQQSTGP